MSLDFAPAALVRASAWPAEVLDAFGTSGLDGGGAAGDEAAYRAAVDREREALWERTAGDPKFMNALLFASPSLVTRIELLAGRRAERNKRIRHAETSLYRYLSRAAGRTTPSGLWAGVALATFGSEDRVTSCAPRYAIAPDLAPFAAALRALGERVPYRDRAKWRLNPTVQRINPGRFELIVRMTSGRIERRGLDATPGLDRLFERLAKLGAATLGELASGAGVDRGTADALAEMGALVGGLALPTWFESPWGALEASGELLLHRERALWVATKKRLWELATELSAGLDGFPSAAIARVLEQARVVLVDLLGHLDVRAEVPAVVLRCDLGLPARIVLGEARRERLHATLAAYQREWLDDASPISAARATRRRALAHGLAGRSVPLGGAFPEDLGASLDPHRPRPMSLEREAPERSSSTSTGARPGDVWAPWGCFIGRLDESGMSTVIGVDDNPARTFARHGDLLGGRHALVEWFAGCVTELRAKHGVVTADLGVPFDARPNVLARPQVGALCVEPWGAEGHDLFGAELRGEQGTLVVRVPGVGRMSVVTLSSANVIDDDPVAELLLLTGFEERVGANFRAASILKPGEDGVPAYPPRGALSTGTAIQRRRTCLAGAHLLPLLGSRGAARFAAWRTIARRLDWARRVTVSIDGGAPLLVDPSSPLAVEAAFEGAAKARLVVVEEADVGGWLVGPRGLHVADVALPFTRAPHAFSTFEP